MRVYDSFCGQKGHCMVIGAPLNRSRSSFIVLNKAPFIPTINVSPNGIRAYPTLFVNVQFRSHSSSPSNVESLPIDELSSAPTQTAIYDYSTDFPDSLMAETTNAVYYEEIPAADTRGLSTTTGDTREDTVAASSARGAMWDYPSVCQGATCQPAGDIKPEINTSGNLHMESYCTENDMYDDVVEVKLNDGRMNKPRHASPSYDNSRKQVELITSADETVLVDNCIYAADVSSHENTRGPVELITSADETVLVDNRLYNGVGRIWHNNRSCT